MYSVAFIENTFVNLNISITRNIFVDIRYDIDKLADFLKQYHGRTLHSIGVRVKNPHSLIGEMAYHSKVAKCIINEIPMIFQTNADDTRVDDFILQQVRKRSKNYD